MCPPRKPEFTYSTSGGLGSLQGRQLSCSTPPKGDVKYDWNLSLNDNVPLGLNLNLGTVDSSMSLGGIELHQPYD